MMWLSLLSPAVVPLIIDTDMGGGGCRDVDDVAAVCMASALQKSGEAELLAIMQNTLPAQTAGVTSVLLHYYGLDSVPIGAYKGTDLQDDGQLSYVADLVDNWPSPIKNTSQVPDAVELYRTTLAAAADHSVAIASIGMLTNLAALLKSPGGRDLVAQKVKTLAIMGGGYPHSDVTSAAVDAAGRYGRNANGCECNFCCAYNHGLDRAVASAASAYVVANVPPEVHVVYSGMEVGVRVLSGGPLTACAPKEDPCRQAFIDNEGAGKSRFSWDPLTTLVAVRGPAAAACSYSDEGGRNTVDAATGTNKWVDGPPTNQTFLLLHNATAAGAAINELLCQL